MPLATTSRATPTPGTKPTRVGFPATGHPGVFVSTVGIVELPPEFHAFTPYVYAVDALGVVSATGKTGVGPSWLIIVNVESALALRYTL